MSVDYRNGLSTGLLSKVTNVTDGKKYNVSTALNAATGYYETAVFKQGVLGMLRGRIAPTILSRDQIQAKWSHYRIEEIIEAESPTGWENAILDRVAAKEDEAAA